MLVYRFIKNPLFPLFIVICAGLLHLSVMWPGILSPDAQIQYNMAINGITNDHHPPFMSFVWGYLNLILPGTGVMFLLHIILLYGSIFYLIISLQTFSFKFVLLLFPLIPQVFSYSNLICKDVSFTFSCLFVASYLSYLTSNYLKITWQQIITLLLILFYGTAVKYQAQYCVPILLAWLAYVIADYKISKKFIKIFIILFLILYTSLNLVNNILVPSNQKSHSWQLVKLYDLAAISMDLNQDLLPSFTKKEHFTMQEMVKRLRHKPLERFKYYMVDDLVFDDAILRIGNNQEERQKLYITWVKAIIKHPLAYIKHRSINLTSMLLYYPSFKYVNKIIINPASIYNTIANGIIYLTMCNLIPTILSVIYFVFGIFILSTMGRNTNWFAIPLVCFNTFGLAMVLVLFFCSMAGTPRYTYVTMCMVHASHIFAYLSYKKITAQHIKHFPLRLINNTN